MKLGPLFTSHRVRELRLAPVLVGSLIAAFCSVTPAQADDVITINQSGTVPIVPGETSPLSDTITGTITTDGTIGVIQSANIVSYDLNLVDNITPADDVTLTPANSAVVEDEGAGLSATATALSFNFSDTGAEFLIQATHGIYSGFQYFCFSASGGACAAGETIVPEYYATEGVEVTGLSGTVPLGGGGSSPPSSAPEIDPASAVSAFTLLLGGLAMIRGRRKLNAGGAAISA